MSDASPRQQPPAPEASSLPDRRAEGTAANRVAAAVQGGAARPFQTERSVETGSDEKLLWSGRIDPRHFGERLALWLIANGVVCGVAIWVTKRFDAVTGWHGFLAAVTVFGLSGLIVVGRVMLRVLNVRYRLTNERLFVEKGLLSRTIDQLELIRVDDVRIEKTLVDRVFGLGTVTIVSTDTTNRGVLIVGVRNPDDVAEAVRSRMRALRKGSLFVENL